MTANSKHFPFDSVGRLSWLAFFAVAIVSLLIGYLGGQLRPILLNLQSGSWVIFGFAAAATAFGGLVGLSEILTRYRDEPLRATFNLFGCVYLLLNGLISLAAFALLRRYAAQIFPAVGDDLFLTAVVAGFGAMIVMRSKLFTFKSPDGKEYAIGPAIVIDTILQTIDQKIDRLRAADRQERVYQKLRDLTDFEGAASYLEASLLSFQNLSSEQKSAISDVITDYRESSWDDRLKIMAMGFAFLTIAGEENFDQVVDNMRRFLENA